MRTKEEVLNGMKELSQDDLKEVIALAIPLIKNPEKGIGTNLFNSLFHIVPQPCVELVVVDKIERPSKILTTYRSDKDPNYPGRRHCPGTYIRLGETDLNAIKRCLKGELGQDVTSFKLVGHYNNPIGCAGETSDGNEHHTVGSVYSVQMAGKATTNVKREWTNSIPADLLKGHKDFASKALGWPIE